MYIYICIYIYVYIYIPKELIALIPECEPYRPRPCRTPYPA